MNQVPTIVNRPRYISPIWILPALAALLGGWLLIQTIANQGTTISIHFDEAVGIKPGKTRILFKGLEVGLVKQLNLEENLQGVEVVAEINPRATSLLRSETAFWLVAPKASLTGISGLDTLVSGNYIAISPGQGEKQTHFTAVETAPVELSGSGLPIRLCSDELGSLSVGTPIYYKRIKVGEVYDFQLSPTHQTVFIDLIIEPRFASLVKPQSRFWNISGIKSELSLEGFSVELEGVANLITGGIAFDSPDEEGTVTPHQQFLLYPDQKASERTTTITLTLPENHGLNPSAKLLLNDITIGQLSEIHLDQAGNPIAIALIKPQYTRYLTSGTQFHLQRPQLSLSQPMHLATLLTGNALQLLPGEGEPNYQFSVQSTPASLQGAEQLQLATRDLKGLIAGTPVNYLGLTIGELTATHLNDAQNEVIATIAIMPEYKTLLTSPARFYIDSPLKIDASLKGVDLELLPLNTILLGQISLLKEKSVSTDLNRLYSSKEDALSKPLKSTVITLHAEGNTKPAAPDAPIYYQGIKIGSITKVRLKGDAPEYQAEIDAPFQSLLTRYTLFWHCPAFAMQASLSGVNLEAAPLSALLNGGIEMANIATSPRNQNDSYPLFEDRYQATTKMIPITLQFDDARSIQEETPIRYRGLTIGKVKNFWLAKEMNRVLARAEIEERFAKPFTQSQARYWQVSPKLGLTGLENLDTLVKGTFIQADPGKEPGEFRDNFVVEQQPPLSKQEDLLINLNAMSTYTLNIGSPVYFRQLQVGSIIGSKLSPDGSTIEFQIAIAKQYAYLVRENSQFWNRSGFKMDIGFTGGSIDAESLQSIISGGISFSSVDGKGANVKEGHRFILHKEAPKGALEWDPKFR